MPEFSVDPRILADFQPLAALRLSQALVRLDSRWMWIVLVPRKPGALEIEHLAKADRAQLLEEIVAAGSAVRAMAAALGRPVEKLNVGALGNRVEQLHVHVVGRRRDDPAWPDPVWGVDGPLPFARADLAAAMAAALPAFEGLKRG